MNIICQYRFYLKTKNIIYKKSKRLYKGFYIKFNKKSLPKEAMIL